MRLRILLALIATLSLGAASQPRSPGLPLPAVPESATSVFVLTGAGDQVEASLLVAPETKELGGRVGVLFDLSPGWHLYWKNAGDSGLPTQLRWQIDAHEVGEPIWPAPKVFNEADGLLTTYGYDGRVLLSAPLLSGIGATGRETLRVHARALVCKLECIPTEFDLSRPLPNSLDPVSRLHFARHDDGVPESPAEAGIVLSATLESTAPSEDGEEDTITAVLEIQSCTANGDEDPACTPFVPVEGASAFIPEADEAYTLTLVGRRALGNAGNRFALEIRGEADIDNASSPTRLRGVLALQRAGGKIRRVEVDVSLHAADAAATAVAVAQRPSGGLWTALLLALLGGIILNGMPCVLPVLAIKIFAIGEMAHRNRRDLVAHGLAYGLGVVGSMVALAALVVALRSAGSAVGWGFQFQEPIFVIAISVVLVAFALNLFGVFEIDLGTGRLATVGSAAVGTRRSFFEGLLAVALATPCSAPFLGTAVGFAFASSAIAIFAIFFCIGLGLALPFLAISFVPALARFVPRSGPWMLKLRTGLAFSLLATVVWLLYVLGQSSDLDAIITLLGFLVALAFGLWVHGQLQMLHRTKVTAIASILLVGFAVAGMNTVRLQIDPQRSRAEAPKAVEGRWRAYDAEEIRTVVTSGQPAFVVFTADWCITCKVNESVVLRRAEVSEALEQGDFALFKADWTRRNESIRRDLLGFGRAGVPLYLVYEGGVPDSPHILPELLTVDRVVGALTVAARASSSEAS